VKRLTAGDMEVLEFERAGWSNGPKSGPKETQVRERFGVSLVRYHQRLQHVLTLPAAEVYDPKLVRRLRRIRDERAARRGWRQVNAS
jgi:hypothetical protein